jgi:hypothetical protein
LAFVYSKNLSLFYLSLCFYEKELSFLAFWVLSAKLGKGERGLLYLEAEKIKRREREKERERKRKRAFLTPNGKSLETASLHGSVFYFRVGA